MKKILIVTGAEAGGAERICVQYAKILYAAHYHVELLLPIGSEGSEEDKFSLKPFIPEYIPVHTFRCRYRALFFKLLLFFLRNKYDIVFSSLFPISSLVALVNACLNKPFTFVFRDCNMPSYHYKWGIWLSRLSFTKADFFVAQTEEMRKQMIDVYHLPPEKVVTINNPIDKELIDKCIKEDFAAMENTVTNYIAVGRIAPQKDTLTLIRAFHIVVKQQPASHLYLIGEGKETYKKEVVNLIEECHLQDLVTFVGFQTNPYKYIQNADVFVLSSIYEGLPNAMIEAMYIGKPVVVTRSIPYIAQVVHEGQNGYTTIVGDYYDFAEKMIKAKDLKALPVGVDVSGSEEKIISLFNAL